MVAMVCIMENWGGWVAMTSGWVGNLKAVVILVIVMVWRLKWRSCVLDKFDMVKVLNMVSCQGS